MIKISRLFSVICLVSFLMIPGKKTSAQLRFDTLNWAPPVDIPIFLAGNFAELRSGHFHAGIDIKTKGHEGYKIYAVQKGYVSRIKVAPDGYGQSVYITHPDGYTSVYGHLREFNIQIGRYVRKAQYEKESFAIDLFLNPDEIPVNKGDVIGLSGNTGSSGGPHLHFEIRDTRSARPMNGLFLGFKIEDNLPPQMFNLCVYPYSDASEVNGKNKKGIFQLSPLNGKYKPNGPDTIEVSGIIGLGIKADDYLNGSSNRCGVYRFNVFQDDSLCFEMQFDGFSFSETHYVSSMLDYAEYVQNNVKAYKLFIEPNNKLSVYNSFQQNGLLSIDIDSIKKITIEAIDAYGNKSTAVAWLKGVKPTKKEDNLNKNKWGWQDEHRIDSSGLLAVFPKETFFDSIDFTFKIDTQIKKNTFAFTYTLQNPAVPIDKSFKLRIKCQNIQNVDKTKLLIVNKFKDKNVPIATQNNNGFVEGESGDLGTFTVMLDTTPPSIKVNPNGAVIDDTNRISNVKVLCFFIEDNLSGIKQYRGSINGNWVLFKYDPKNKLLFYESDEYLQKAKNYKLELNVTDNKGNKATFTKVYGGDIL